MKFSIKLFNLSCLICAVNLQFAHKLLRKAKLARGCYNCTKFLKNCRAPIGTGLRLGRVIDALFKKYYKTSNKLVLMSSPLKHQLPVCKSEYVRLKIENVLSPSSLLLISSELDYSRFFFFFLSSLLHFEERVKLI